MDLLLSLPAVRASPPVLQCNHRNIILNKILLLLRQCMVQLARPVASLKLLVLPLQQSGAQGTEPWCPGQILPPATSLHLLVLSPCQEDSLQAVWEGQQHGSCVWFAGAVANPAKPLAAYPCSCWCIYSKSCKLKVSMVSAPSLDSGEDQAPLRLTGWPCRGLGACTLGVPPAA